MARTFHKRSRYTSRILSAMRKTTITGTEIRAMRKAVHATQTELAGALGLSQGTVARLERGELAPSSSTALVLRILQSHLARGGRLSSFMSTLGA